MTGVKLHFSPKLILCCDWLICYQVNTACASQAYVVPGLLEGQEYLFRVRAENRLGFGPFTVTTDPVRAQDPICKETPAFTKWT